MAGARLDDLWAALSNAPPGRILFVRSSVPLAYGRQWWRPHSHITALAPIRTGREIVNGTFTHPSPIAGLVYTGAAANRPITLLVEQRDGLTLFGRPLEALTPAEFDRLAGRLRISAVVALDEDDGRLPFLDDNPGFARPSRVGPFVIYASREPRRDTDARGARSAGSSVPRIQQEDGRPPASPTRRSGARAPAISDSRPGATTWGCSR